MCLAINSIRLSLLVVYAYLFISLQTPILESVYLPTDTHRCILASAFTCLSVMFTCQATHARMCIIWMSTYRCMCIHTSILIWVCINPYLGVYQYFLSTTLLVADNSTTGAWHLDQLAIGEERAKEHKRQRGQMGKCERNLIGNRGSANASSSSTI